jgi:hypothetical protein
MKIKGIVAMLALGAALSALPSSAEARHRHSRSRHHYSNFGVRIYANPYPVYGSYGYAADGYAADPYWSDDRYYDRSYGAWDDESPYPYYRSCRRVYREPVVRFHFHGGHRCYRTHRHYRGRW